eukprot:scaffold4717_cov274-Pinguiococcus_pyrenoidosus.AAC.1
MAGRSRRLRPLSVRGARVSLFSAALQALSWRSRDWRSRCCCSWPCWARQVRLCPQRPRKPRRLSALQAGARARRTARAGAALRKRWTTMWASIWCVRRGGQDTEAVMLSGTLGCSG